METMFKKNFGGTNKEYCGIFESGLQISLRGKNENFCEMCKNILPC